MKYLNTKFVKCDLIFKMWRVRKIKYCLILVGCVFIVNLIILPFRALLGKWLHRHNVVSSVNLQYVMVHFDLKGSPPKMSYLVSLLPILRMYGVNSILMEYEDMFPYEGSIVNVSSEYHYRRDELIMFLNKAKLLDMEIIPLIQTFAHMEYALKLEEFAQLREIQNYPGEICPSNPPSIILISSMLSQVIRFHATIVPLKHIHIGCDEVFKINKCPKCRKRNLNNTALYLDHVKVVSAKVTKLSPNTKVLIWGDMIQNVHMQLPTTILSNIEPIWWNYNYISTISHTVLYNLHKQFKDIWVASAFKGADGNTATIPNIANRFRNNLNWLKSIWDYKFGGETKVFNFKGIILTGWSRYNHLSPQCELLPIAMPSLILNLLLIKNAREGFDNGDLQNMEYCDLFNKYLKTDFENIFISYDKPNKHCSFENTMLYKEHQIFVSKAATHVQCLHRLYYHEGYYSFDRSVDILSMEITFKQCRQALKYLSEYKKRLVSFMSKYYSMQIIKSYVDEKINIPTESITRIMSKLENATTFPLWKRRH